MNNLIQQSQLHLDKHYIQTIRPWLPGAAFQKNPSQIIYFLVNFLIWTISIILARYVHNNLIFFLIALIAGHSLACMASFGHYLSHGSVIRKGILKELLEITAWGLNFIPRTMWIHVHNRTHHTHTSTPKDPDRRWFTDEKNLSRWIYTWLLYPQKSELFPGLINPFVFIHFAFYISRNLISAFFPDEHKFCLVPYQIPYNRKEKVAIIGELAIIAGINLLMFVYIEGNWIKYFFVGILPLLISSSVLSTYTYTHHFLNPIYTTNNSVIGTTSVIVPQWINLLHDNLSYHTEHHLFPGMNPAYYPLVSDLLKKHFPQDYNQLPMTEAWRRLWNSQAFDT